MTERLQQLTVRMAQLCLLPVTGVAGVAAVLFPGAQGAANAQVMATPDGAGTTVTDAGGQYDITGGTQAGGNLFHEFDEFSLDSAQTANFVSDSGVFNIVGQVSAANPSYIDGTVQVTGSDADLYLVNPSGVLFGPDAQVSLSGSFAATTADQIEFDGAVLNVLDNGADYSSFTGDPSAFHFTQTSASAVVNQGDVAVAPGESISLVGGSVVNAGTLSAPGGEIGLVAAEGESVVRYGLSGSLLSLEVVESAVPAGNAFSVTDVFTLLTGSTTPLVNEMDVRLDGSVRLSNTLVNAEEVAVSGDVSTRSAAGDGGVIALVGNSVDVLGPSVIDASGDNGGAIRIGGDLGGQGPLPNADAVLVKDTSAVRADGLAGAGGDIAIWSGDRAYVRGDISAEGTTSGGLIDTSAARLDLKDLAINASGQTESGQWLIDSVDTEIVNSSAGFNQIAASLIESTLDSGTDVALSTTRSNSGNGDIVLSESIDQNGGGDANLTLTSRRFINNGSTVDLSSGGQLTFGINQVSAEASADTSLIERAIAAIGEVNGERIIRLGEGNYSFDQRILLDKKVAIEGANPLTTVLSTSTPGVNIFRIVPNTEVALRNLTVTTSGLLPGELGGGIVNQGLLTVDNTIFENNRSFHNGGAIDSFNGGPVAILNSTFRNNRSGADGSGGAIHLGGLSGTSRISNTVFEENTSVRNGGAVSVSGSTVLLDNGTLFDGNTALEGGGGLSVVGTGRADIDGVTFDGNVANQDGGAIITNEAATVGIEESTIRDNEAGEAGGGIFLDVGSVLSIDATDVISNTAQEGGGIYSLNSTLNTFDGTRFVLNEATLGDGGAIALWLGQAHISDTTFSRNEATQDDGGAIAAENNTTLRVDNQSVFADNTAGDDGGGIYVSRSSTATIDTVEVRDNEAIDGGGGVYVSVDSEATLIDVNLLRNTARAGGGLRTDDSNVVVQSRSVPSGTSVAGKFSFNSAVARSQAVDGGDLGVTHGGAVAQLGGSLSLLNVRLARNDSEGAGGGLFVAGSATTIVNDDTDFSRNTSMTNGGAIALTDASNLTMGTTFINSNMAGGAGGGLFTESTAAVAIDSTLFFSNEAATDGGALSLGGGGDTTLLTFSLSDNAAQGDGGAIHLRSDSGNLVIDSASLVGNRADGDGGAIANLSDTATVTLTNASVDDNSAGGNGGAVYTQANSISSIASASVNRNQAGVDASGNPISSQDGGAIYVTGDAGLSLERLSLMGNTATDQGGAIYYEGNQPLTVNNADLEGNTAQRDGGAIANHSSNGTLSITGNDFKRNISQEDGGAIFATNDSTTHSTENLFNNNSAEGVNSNGGAIALENGATLTLTSDVVSHNYAQQAGGGLYLGDRSSATVAGTFTTDANGAPTTSTTRFSHNEAGQHGGGISAVDAGSLAVREVLFQENIAGVDGGGLRLVGGTATVDMSQFNENTATYGAGIEISGDGNVTVLDSSFSQNQASARGGGIHNDDVGMLVVSGSTFEQNEAAVGGAISNSAESRLINTTLSNNVASDEGGAISSDPNSQLQLSSSTVANNRATHRGGGIDATGALLVRLQNTIVAANSSASSVDVRGNFIDEGNNLIGQADGATGLNNSALVGSAASPINPNLATLAHNGGPTKTHLLLADSIAIESGSASSPLATDQRGQLRLSGHALDIGAVELSDAERPVAAVEIPEELPETPLPFDPTLLPFDPTLSTTRFGSLDSPLAVRPEPRQRESEASVRRLERHLSQPFEDYWDLSAGPDLALADVQAILRRAQEEYKVNSAVIYVTFAPAESAAEESATILHVDPTPQDDDLLNLSVVLPAGELVNYQLPVTRKEAVRQVLYFRSATADEYDARGYQPLAQQMYQWLLAPIEADLAAQNIHNLMYALDSGLRTAPISAMRDYEGFSLARYGISMVPSMGLLQADFPVAVRRSTVAMGVSQFDAQEPLPAVPIELAVVDQFVPVSQTALNEATTIDTLKSIQTLEQPGILHLATHADFDRRSPEDSLIHLWDGPLSMKEFSHLDWEKSDLEMLILSACSTALGSRNSELGFAGLAAASGVDATVGSLWEVSDVGTLVLMSEFYAQLETTDLRFDALRQAQLALINGDTRIENGNLITSKGEIDLPDEWDLPASATLDHPYFWSAFTMVGNPW